MDPYRRVFHVPRLAVLAAGILCYLLLLHFLRDSRSITVAALLFQYAVLLPCLLWLPAGLRDSSQSQLILTGMAWVLMGAYGMLAIPLAKHEYDWPTNPGDESCYSFQARIFRTGRVIADPLPGVTDDVKTTPTEINYQNHVMTPGRWYTHFPPGWPVLLVAGQWLGAPWILAPLLGLILLRLIFVISRDTFSMNTAEISVLMAVLSPFFLVNAVRMLSHMLCAALVAGACFLLLCGLARKHLLPIASALAMLVIAFQVRPYTVFAEGLVLGGTALWYLREDRKFARQVMLAEVIAGLAALLTMMVYDHATTGHVAVSPYAARIGSQLPSELTFNPRLIIYLFHHWGWVTFTETVFSTFPFLFLLAGYAVWKESKKKREVRILAWVFAILPIAHLLHTDNSYSYFGSRFHFEGLFAAFILAARGAELLAQHWALPRRGMLVVVGLLAAMQFPAVWGMVRSLWHVGAPYHEIKASVARLDGEVPLVFLRDGAGYKARFTNFNDPDWRHSTTLYLIDADPRKRDEWACRVGRLNWVALSVDTRGEVEQQIGHSNCPSGE